jgi:hypothetical protein
MKDKFDFNQRIPMYLQIYPLLSPGHFKNLFPIHLTGK